jgi:hypothetical protein
MMRRSGASRNHDPAYVIDSTAMHDLRYLYFRQAFPQTRKWSLAKRSNFYGDGFMDPGLSKLQTGTSRLYVFDPWSRIGMCS